MGSLLNSYVRKLREAGYETNRIRIVIDLFHAAGAKSEPAEGTISSWLKGRSKCRVTDYFDEGKISEAGKQGFINYFVSKKDPSWKKLQNKFASDENFKWVDCKAEDEMQFSQSLLNEFLRCLNIPVEILENPKVKKAKEPKKERMVDIFYLFMIILLRILLSVIRLELLRRIFLRIQLELQEALSLIIKKLLLLINLVTLIRKLLNFRNFWFHI